MIHTNLASCCLNKMGLVVSFLLFFHFFSSCFLMYMYRYIILAEGIYRTGSATLAFQTELEPFISYVHSNRKVS